jgi:hypothetical protein
MSKVAAGATNDKWRRDDERGARRGVTMMSEAGCAA